MSFFCHCLWLIHRRCVFKSFKCKHCWRIGTSPLTTILIFLDIECIAYEFCPNLHFSIECICVFLLFIALRLSLTISREFKIRRSPCAEGTTVYHRGLKCRIVFFLSVRGFRIRKRTIGADRWKGRMKWCANYALGFRMRRIVLLLFCENLWLLNIPGTAKTTDNRWKRCWKIY